MTTEEPSSFEPSPEGPVTTDSVAALLQLLEIDAAPVNDHDLQLIRTKTRAAFHMAMSQSGTSQSRTSRQDDHWKVKQPKITRSPWLAIATAVASLVFSVWLLSPSEVTAAPNLAQALLVLKNATSVSMEIQTPDGNSKLLLKAPGIVRWENGDGKFQIADGHRLWKVDPSTGNVSDEPSPLPAEGTNAFSLLKFTEFSPSDFRSTSHSSREFFEGAECLVYEADVTVANKPARLETYVHAETGTPTLLRLLKSKGTSEIIAEVRLTAINAAIPGDAFRINRSLKDNGRVGAMSETHGLVFIRAFPSHRWTPASNSMPLFIGDQIRCEARGANAAILRLNNGAEITLGPSALLEVASDDEVRLLTGDAKIGDIGRAAGRQPSVSYDPASSATDKDAAETYTEGLRPAARRVHIVGPDGTPMDITEPTILRASNETPSLTMLDIEPAWLATLSENVNAETMGSLVAQVDGRDVSLTLGFHHVTVEIRDQIAKTVIEESFVNNTDQRLEGQFHFPLPHDASISGFGMWIGNELVEADVVEKQRAREIYETILREKRDPGLLEWEGGNIFKARVFPIEAHGEKKIRITYTQTLPLQNGTFRYNYALRSELLQKTPLRDLAIDVTVHSKTPLAKVECPSHGVGSRIRENSEARLDRSSGSGILTNSATGEATIEQTTYSARLHYDARDITPERDFEFLCTLDGRQADVVAIPHVRGDDGYFQLQLSPPSLADGNWSRMMVRDGTPLDVIVVCDTSRSMDKVARQQQHELVAALLGSLSEADRVRVACCDVETAWLLKDAAPVTDTIRAGVIASLEQRRSLGWSDLQRTFRDVLSVADANTKVVYIGDGTVIAQDSDAGSAFAAWMKNARNGNNAEPTCHAIAVGNAFDMTVLSAIGRKGRGTTRVAAMSTPASDTIRDLLFEITRPGLRDLKVEFRNVQVAAVYPTELPNLPDGMQQIITGRFLPSGTDAEGEVIVTGRRGDEVVKYVARMPLSSHHSPSDESAIHRAAGRQPSVSRDSVSSARERDGAETHTEGLRTAARLDENSFIPRLWAKQHIDHLLMEASTPEIKQQIIALSQEFHLITPFTSLLVLETDADRRRFGVERSMQMRDGEQFFADGRKEAEYSLRQQQLEVAKFWRQQLHDQMRNQIGRYGRDEFAAVQLTPVIQANKFSFYVPLNDTIESRTTPLTSNFSTFGTQDANVATSFVSRFGRRSNLNSELVREHRFSGRDRELFFNGLMGLKGVEPPVLSEVDDFYLGTPILHAVVGNVFCVDPPVIEIPGMLTFSEPTQRRSVLTSPANRHTIVNPLLVPGLFRSRENQTLQGTSAGGEGGLWRNAFGYLFDDVQYYDVNHEGFDVLDGTPRTLSDSILVEPPTFGLRGVLPESPAAIEDRVNWPDKLQKLVPAIVHRRGARTASGPVRFTKDWPAEIVELMTSMSSQLDKIPGGLIVKQVERSIHPTRGRAVGRQPSVLSPDPASSEKDSRLNTEGLRPAARREEVVIDDWSTITWLPSLGWTWHQKSSLGPVHRWSVGDQSGATNSAYRFGQFATHPLPPETCSIPYEFVDERYGNPSDSIWSEWLPAIESRDDANAVILMTHRTQPWREIRIRYDVVRKCALQQDTLTDGEVVSQIELTDHVQVAGFWIAGRVVISELEPLRRKLVVVAEHTLELQEISKDDATQLLEGERQGVSPPWKSPANATEKNETRRADAQPLAIIYFPEQLPTATVDDQLTRVFQLWHQARWDDAILLLDQTLAAKEMPESAQWIRWLLLIDARRMDALKPEVSAAISKALETPKPDSHEAAEAFIARLSLLRTFAQWTMSDAEFEAVLVRLIQHADSLQTSHPESTPFLQMLMQERIGTLLKLRRRSDAMAVRQDMLQRWPDSLSRIQEMVNLDLQDRKSTEAIAMLESSLAADRQWTLDEWNKAFEFFLNFRRQRGEFDDGLALCERWIAQCPMSQQAYGHLLRSLIELDRADDVRARVKEWLEAGERLGVSPPWKTLLNSAPLTGTRRADALPLAQLNAAMEFGFGRVAGLTLAGPELEFTSPMLKVAEQFAATDRHLDIADLVFGHSNIAKSDDGRTALKRLLADENGVATMSTHRLNLYFTWIQNTQLYGAEREAWLQVLRTHLDESLLTMDLERARVLLMTYGQAFDEKTPADQRQRWFDMLLARWRAADDALSRTELASFIDEFEQKAFDAAHRLNWLRTQLKEARDAERSTAANALFQRLLAEPWSSEIEVESYALIDQILSADKPNARLAQRLPLLQQWVSSMTSQRVVHHQGQVAEFDTLPSRQRQHAARECRVKAVRDMIEILKRRAVGRQPNGTYVGFPFEAARREPSGFCKFFEYHHRTACAVPLKMTAIGCQPSVWQDFVSSARDGDAAETHTEGSRPTARQMHDAIILHRLMLQAELAESELIAGVSDVEQKTLLEEIAKDTRELLGPEPVPSPDPKNASQDAEQIIAKSVAIRHRHFAFALWLHAAMKLDNGIDGVLNYVRRGIEIDTIAPDAWRAAEFGILIALDRAEELVERLPSSGIWRIHHAQLLAELDRLEEAVALYEADGKRDRLTAKEWQQLSVWQHALDRRTASDESLRQSWVHSAPHEIQKQLQSELQQWQSGGENRTPTAPDNVKERFAILLPKTKHTDHAALLLANWYKATHDPLLLQNFASLATGRSRAEMFSAIEHAQSTLNDIDQEAGIDAALDSIAKARAILKADETSQTDRLALQLLEMQTTAAGARVTNQPGPHIHRAIAAMQTLIKEPWQAGERQRFALRLHNLPIPNVELKAARRQAMKSMIQSTPAKTVERLEIVELTARIAAEEKDSTDAITLMESELQAVIAAAANQTQGQLGITDDVNRQAVTLLKSLVDILQKKDRYLAAESWLATTSQSLEIPDRITLIEDVQIAALYAGGQTSKGKKESLYRSLWDQKLAAVLNPDEASEFSANWGRLFSIFRAGMKHQFSTVKPDIRSLATVHSKSLVRHHSAQDADIVDTIQRMLSESNQRPKAIEFLVEQLEAQPLALQWTAPRQRWDNFADDLFDLTSDSRDGHDLKTEYTIFEDLKRPRGALRPLRDRFESVMFVGLEQSWLAGSDSHGQLFASNSNDVWQRGEAKFQDVVKRVAEAKSSSQSHLLMLGNILRSRGNHAQSIEMLQAAFERKVLDSNGQNNLINWLLEAQRWADVIPVLEDLIVVYPEEPRNHLTMMTCLYHTKQKERLLAELNQLRTTLIIPETAGIEQVWELADRCRSCELWKHAADLYQTGITRQGWPTQPAPALARAWRSLAECQAKLQQIPEALDSVSAAWVVCGQNAADRNAAQAALGNVMSDAENLEAIRQFLDRKAADSGDDSSFLRRALGKALHERNQFGSAEAQLRIALELQPQDHEAWTWLIASLDQQHRAEDAIAAMLDESNTDHRNLDLYRELHRRFTQASQPMEAERAATSIIEVDRTESDNHVAIAKLRESEKQISTAIHHWEIAVELRAYDPAPLIRLAYAQKISGDQAAARRTLNQLTSRKWNARFESLADDLRKLRRALR